MKFEVGDTVVVNQTNEEGQVIDIINEKMVMVEVRGVKFPAYVDQLDFPYFKRFTEKKLFPPKKEKKFIDDMPREKKKITQRVVDGIWLTFIPVTVNDEFGDDIVTELKVHLVNRTEQGYKFTYKLNYLNSTDFELVNQIHAFEDFYLHDVPFENMNDSPVFGFEFSLVTPDKNKAEYYEASVKLKPKQVFTRIEEVRKKGEATFSYKLFDEYPGRPYEDKPDGLDLAKDAGSAVGPSRQLDLSSPQQPALHRLPPGPQHHAFHRTVQLGARGHAVAVCDRVRARIHHAGLGGAAGGARSRRAHDQEPFRKRDAGLPRRFGDRATRIGSDRHSLRAEIGTIQHRRSLSAICCVGDHHLKLPRSGN